MSNERYKWHLSPSKFEASKGCACFEEDPRNGAEYKDAGTNLHAVMEKDLPLTDLTPEETEWVQFCLDWRDNIESQLDLVVNRRELKLKANNLHPNGVIDQMYFTEEGTLYIADYKFGTQRVADPSDNEQIKAYAYMGMVFINDLQETEIQIPDITSIVGIVIMPQLKEVMTQELDMEDVAQVGERMKELNDRVADPFKQPDPSNPDKCGRCKHFDRCPATQSAVTEFVSRTALLPMPDSFEPSAIVSERDRVMAQDLAKILETWADIVKKNNREYARANGGTIGGIYNMTTRANGVEVDDNHLLADRLIEHGLITDKAELLDAVKVSQAAIVNAVCDSPDNTLPASAVKAVVKEIFEEVGTPRPPVEVFRRGGKAQVREAEESLGISAIADPWK